MLEKKKRKRKNNNKKVQNKRINKNVIYLKHLFVEEIGKILI